MIKVAINGFGRIGRLAFREMMKNQKLEIVAINDLSTPSMLAYLLKYDSIQGTFKANIGHTSNELIVDKKQFVKTVAWYDNEMSFVSQMIRTVEYFGSL